MLLIQNRNIMGGTKYLRLMYEMFGENWTHALCAYKEGPAEFKKLFANNKNFDPVNQNAYTREVVLQYKALYTKALSSVI